METCHAQDYEGKCTILNPLDGLQQLDPANEEKLERILETNVALQ